jgi:hypothetical protein
MRIKKIKVIYSMYIDFIQTSSSFPMTPRTLQCNVFWALLLSSKHSGVPQDPKSQTLEVLGFTPTLGQSGVATPDMG